MPAGAALQAGPIGTSALPGRHAVPAVPAVLQAVHMELSKPRPSIKLLYVTPEQLVKGERLKRELG